MDLSRLSDEDLIELNNNNISGISDDGLRILAGEERIQEELDSKKPMDTESFDAAKEQTTGQPVEEPSLLKEMAGANPEIMDERMKAFETPYKNEVFNELGEIGGGYHAEALGGTVVGRGAIGAAKAVVKPALLATRIAEELLGGDINAPDSWSGLVSGVLSDLEKLRNRGMVRQGIGGKIDIAGNAAEIAAPIGVIAKLNIIKRLGNLGKAGKAVSKAAQAHPMAAGSLGGGVIGAGFGAQEYQPKEGEDYSWDEAKTGATGGAAFGMAVTPIAVGAGKAVKGAKRLIKHPFTARPDKIFVKGVEESGEKLDDVLATMKDKKFESKTAGVKRTVGQKLAANKKLNVPQAMAVEDLAEGTAPQAMWAAKQKQAAARLAEVQKISRKSPYAEEKAKDIRRLFTAPLYKKASKSTEDIVVAPVIKEIDDILRLHGNEKIAEPLGAIKSAMTKTAKMTQADKDAAPSILKVLKDSGAFGNAAKLDPEGVLAAEKILSGQGGKKAASNVTVQKMMSLSRGIKEMMKAQTATGKALYNNSMLSKVKDTLDKQIGLASPDFAKATALYKKHSVPVERIKIGKQLAAKLTDPMEIEKRGAAFAGEIHKLKTKREYGKPLWESLSKDQQKSMENVLADLHVNADFALQSKAAYSSAAAATEGASIGGIGMFKPWISALRSRIDSKLGLITKRGMKELSVLMQEPEKLAHMIEKGSPEQKKAMVKILDKWIATPGLIFSIKEASKNEE